MSQFIRIVGVYHAEGSLRGELAYALGKLLGTANCALCDITHRISEKAEFKACRARFPVHLETLHLDEQGDDLASFSRGKTPCVAGLTAQGWRLLLDRAALARCEGSVSCFEQALARALDRLP